MLSILAVDVGNTNIKYATICGGEIGEVRLHPTIEFQSAAQEIAEIGLPVALCSVRREATEEIKSALSARGLPLHVEITSDLSHPVRGFYPGMGADRIAMAAGAVAQVESACPVAVVGLGTGTTITTVSADRKFHGGLTSLGLGPICQTLQNALPQLPPIEPMRFQQLLPGRDVYSALLNGTISGHVGMVEYWVEFFKKELGDQLIVYASGGWSELIGSLTKRIDRVDRLLTFKGIWAIAKDHAGEPLMKKPR